MFFQRISLLLVFVVSVSVFAVDADTATTTPSNLRSKATRKNDTTDEKTRATSVNDVEVPTNRLLAPKNGRARGNCNELCNDECSNEGGAVNIFDECVVSCIERECNPYALAPHNDGDDEEESSKFVPVCHREDDDDDGSSSTVTYHFKMIPNKALRGHLGHGDSQPGDDYPDMEGFTFDIDCSPINISESPSRKPSSYPSVAPSSMPSAQPSTQPSPGPSDIPSSMPSASPSLSTMPSYAPTSADTSVARKPISGGPVKNCPCWTYDELLTVTANNQLRRNEPWTLDQVSCELQGDGKANAVLQSANPNIRLAAGNGYCAKGDVARTTETLQQLTPEENARCMQQIYDRCEEFGTPITGMTLCNSEEVTVGAIDYKASSWIYPPESLVGQRVRKVKVEIVSFTHPSVDQVRFEVRKSGTDVDLAYKIVDWAYDSSSWGANFFNTVFDDDATERIIGYRAPYTGSFHPKTTNGLSLFNNSDAGGAWELKMTHNVIGSNSGTLYEWCVVVTTDVNPPSFDYDWL